MSKSALCVDFFSGIGVKTNFTPASISIVSDSDIWIFLAIHNQMRWRSKMAKMSEDILNICCKQIMCLSFIQLQRFRED